MPAHSEHQQHAAGAALAAKRGRLPRKKLRGASKSRMSMSEEQLRHFAQYAPKRVPR